jgi:hypothetical protein
MAPPAPHRRRADSNFVLVYSLVGWRWSSSSPRSERTIDVDRPLSSYGVGFDNSGFAEQADYDGQRRSRDEKCGSRSGSAEFGDPPRNPAISRRRVESVLFQGISTFCWFVFASHRHHIPKLCFSPIRLRGHRRTQRVSSVSYALRPLHRVGASRAEDWRSRDTCDRQPSMPWQRR